MATVDKALGVLMCFADAEGPLGVGDVAEATALSKSYVSRVLKALKEAGMLEQDLQTRRYSIGLNAFALGAGYPRQSWLVQAAWPHMREISQATQHTVYASVRNYDHARHVMAVEGQKYMESQWRVGIRLPLHATASGKLLLAYADDTEISTILDSIKLRRYTKNTITDKETLALHLNEIVRNGYSMAMGENVEGLVALAVPVSGKEEKVIGALGIVSPQIHLKSDEHLVTVEILKTYASRISSSLGARVYSFGP